MRKGRKAVQQFRQALLSSGARWTEEEDERLYRAVIALTAQFAGRSLSAVLTRIVLLSPSWWKRKNANAD